MDITIGGGGCSSPLKLDLGNITIDHGYNGIKLDGNLHIIKPINSNRLETLSALLGNLIQYKESDMAKLTLIDKESQVLDIIEQVLFKIQQELTNF